MLNFIICKLYSNDHTFGGCKKQKAFGLCKSTGQEIAQISDTINNFKFLT